MDKQNSWLSWAIELQSLAQAGLTYGHDPYDLERYKRIREISAEMVAHKSDIPAEKVKELFCNETGYQTPKVDTRAAIFNDGKILLVHESNGTWSLPGGWCDVNQSVAENTVKETFEEAGLRVTADRLIAVQDRNKHNKPIYAYGVVKVSSSAPLSAANSFRISKRPKQNISEETNCRRISRAKDLARADTDVLRCERERTLGDKV